MELVGLNGLGAEPIRPETLDKFTTTFEPCGFSRSTFYPCYGMAETTLLVTGGDRTKQPVIYTVNRTALERNQIAASSNPAENKALIGCGHSWLDQKVSIVDPDTQTLCPPNKIGEIWVSGGSIAKGYWQRPEQTEETFQAHIAGSNEGPFLRTGDLGFLNDNELFITGRLKDVIIIRGRNHYPQDIELTVETAHEALQSNSCAAFSVDLESAEQLVVVQEVKRPYLRILSDPALTQEIILSIRRALSETHELQLYAVVLLKPGSLPKTSSGKVQRKQCRKSFLEETLNPVAEWTRQLQTETPELDQSFAVNLESLPNEQEKIQAVETWLTQRIAQRVQISPTDINRQEPLASYGLNSLQVIEMSTELEAWLGRTVLPTIVYDFPTIAALATQLIVGETNTTESKHYPTASRFKGNDEIAVVGIGCRFPGAQNIQAFWRLLHEGQDAITEVPLSRWDVDDTQAAATQAARWGGFLKQIDLFDPKFFGISPREAVHMDPQQRLLLEVCWETLENAGIAADQLAGSQSGIFLGVSNGDYSRLQGPQLNTDVYYGTGNAFSIAANRLSYLFDWHGPSFAVDTACSSSLVAVHQACNSLLTGECNFALAGGVNLILSPQLTVTFSQAQMMAADGRCKTFDASADGYVRSEGCGIVALKRLSAATADGDTVLGIIKGSAINQDGRSNGLTAPNSLAQQSVIRQALSNAGIGAQEVDYIEAHGTGTALGDPIEVNSLKAVFTASRTEDCPCWLGSVKTNIGHLEPAAGIAGLIKVLLALQHEEIPAHLHLKKVNPYIQLNNSPLEIATEQQPWVANEQPRIAGVSAFGFGGTNAHVIVSEAAQPASEIATSDSQTPADEASLLLKPRPLQLLTLSAKSEAALQALVMQYQDWLTADNRNITTLLGDICFTANAGRSHFSHRLALIASSTDQLQTQLQSITDQSTGANIFTGAAPNQRPPKIAFLFTGQGAQYFEMGQELYATHPIFRAELNRCADVLKNYDIDLLKVLYQENNNTLDQTAYTQPALFAIEYALAQLWKSWGIKPEAVLGHSVGEYAAACIAGIFSLEDGLKLIAERGRLMQALPPGGEMISLLATVEQTQQWIEPYAQSVSIAAINGPSSVVISGEGEALSAIARTLSEQNIKHKKLTVSHAFHSPLMEPVLADFQSVAQTVSYTAPTIPFISCLTGKEITDAIATPDYWIQHIQQPVKFADGIHTLHQKGYQILLEVGPKPLLLGMAKQCLSPTDKLKDKARYLPSLRPDHSNWQRS
ncbi:MAG: beta-ketoacyl synthase N-terminal-like domain-containing protein, partial [Cyanobacteria bacterium J06560_2]